MKDVYRDVEVINGELVCNKMNRQLKKRIVNFKDLSREVENLKEIGSTQGYVNEDIVSMKIEGGDTVFIKMESEVVSRFMKDYRNKGTNKREKFNEKYAIRQEEMNNTYGSENSSNNSYYKNDYYEER